MVLPLKKTRLKEAKKTRTIIYRFLAFNWNLALPSQKEGENEQSRNFIFQIRSQGNYNPLTMSIQNGRYLGEYKCSSTCVVFMQRKKRGF